MVNGTVRILSVDYGDVRTGLAISDLLGLIASPLPTFKTRSMRSAIDYIADVARENEVDRIVVGLPLNMDGSEGERARKTRAFARVLERVCAVPVILEDERLTSVEAENILIEGNVKRDKRKQLLDSMAARLILQSYLDRTVK